MRIDRVIYLMLLLAINVIVTIRWNRIGKGERIVALLMFFTLIEELVAAYAAYRWHNNFPVYHIYSPLEFFLIALYFNHSLRAFRKRGIGIVVGITGLIIGGINTIFFQSLYGINSYFLLFESTAVIIFCLFSIHEVLLEEVRMPGEQAHFWIMICFLIYWCATFTGWGLYPIISKPDFVLKPVFEVVLDAANHIFYFGISIIFLRIKRLIPSGD